MCEFFCNIFFLILFFMNEIINWKNLIYESEKTEFDKIGDNIDQFKENTTSILSNIDWNTYFFLESANKHIENKDLKLISNKDIDKYVNFLPWNIDNKLSFFQNVLNLKLNWYTLRCLKK